MRKFTICLFWLLISHSVVFSQSDTLTVEHVQQLEQQLLELQEKYQTIVTSNNDLTAAIEEYNKTNNELYDQLRDDFSAQSITQQSLTEQIVNLRTTNNALQNNVTYLTSQLSETVERADEMTLQIERANDEIETVERQLQSDIEQTGLQADEQYAMLGQSLSRNTFYWIISVSLTLLLAIGFFIILKRKTESGDDKLMAKINATKKELELEGLKLDQKLIDVLNSQMKMLDTTDSPTGEQDHSLALKIADEVTRISMNLSHMDPATKGWKQLDRSARAIINNFKANGYEIPELIGKPFDENMNAITTAEIDENLGPDEKIIKRVVKPQVNYNGKMIQPAQIVVAAGV